MAKLGFGETVVHLLTLVLESYLCFSLLCGPSPSPIQSNWTGQFMQLEVMVLLWSLHVVDPQHWSEMGGKLAPWMKTLTECGGRVSRVPLLFGAVLLPFWLSLLDLTCHYLKELEEGRLGPGLDWEEFKGYVQLKCLGSFLVMLLIQMVFRLKSDEAALYVEKEEANAAAVSGRKMQEILSRLESIQGENKTLKEELYDAHRSLELILEGKLREVGAGEGGLGLLQRLALED